MWNPFKKKAKETEEPHIRIEVEDLIDQGWKCREIAAELGISEDKVYTIKEARRRRNLAAATKSERQDTDRISELREELQVVELNDRIDQAKHKAFLRQREREEYETEDAEELIEDANNPDKLIQTLLLNAALKHQNPGATPGVQQPLGNIPQPPRLNVEDTPPSGLDFNRVEKAVKLGLVSEEKFVQEAAALNLTPEKAAKLYKFIKEGL